MRSLKQSGNHHMKLTTTYIHLLFAMLLSMNVNAQKNTAVVTESSLTGISLPANSKKDNRGLSVMAAKKVLELEAKKRGNSVNTVEVLYLPASSGFHIEQLSAALISAGWSFSTSETDKEYGWLQKGNRSFISYYVADNSTICIFFGELNTNTTNQANNNPPQENKTEPIQTAPEKTTNTQQTTALQSSTGHFTFTTTNFDDGWTSTVYDDYVLVSKNKVKVLLSYVEPFEASDYSGTGKEARFFYWDTYVSKYFITGEKLVVQATTFSDDSPHYVEGWATDRQTCEKRFIGMILRIIPYTGTLSIIVASAPDDVLLHQQFPRAARENNNDLISMYDYNRFAVAKKDLYGTWVSGNESASLTWYSTVTGNNAGTTAVARSDEFTFNSNGLYSSTHKGASGWVGAMNTYQQEYKGNYTVSNWNVTATNHFEGKTESYEASFIAVKGGRILKLKNGVSVCTLLRENK